MSVVEMRAHQEGQSLFLLVQRPSTGLLASLWDFPSVHLGPRRDVSYAEARQLIDAQIVCLLGRRHPISCAIIASQARESKVSVEARVYAGETSFLFTHIKHFYHVEWLCLSSPPGTPLPTTTPVHSEATYGDSDGGRGLQEGTAGTQALNIRWLREEELKQAAIPKGMKNCFELAIALRTLDRSDGGRKKRQRSIDSFFTKPKDGKP